MNKVQRVSQDSNQTTSVLSCHGMASKNPDSVEQIIDNRFNLLIMDEAHHIRWDGGAVCKWLIAKRLS